MPSIPRVTGPSVASAPLPGVRQGLDIPIEAVSSGRMFEKAGRDISAAADKLDTAATRIQDQQDTDLVFQADTALKTAYLEYQNAANQRKGVNAWGLQQETTKWFDDNIAKIGATLTDRQRRVYEQRAAQLRLAGLDYYGRYELQERNAATELNNAANIDSAINVAASDPIDNNIAAAVKVIDQNTKANAKLFGWSPEVVNAKVTEATGKLHQQVLQGLIENDPMQAEQYLNAHRAEIPGAMLAELDKGVRIGTAKARSQEFADEVIATGLSEAEAVKHIREKYKGDEEDIYISEVRSRFAEIEAARNRAERAAADEAWRIIGDGGAIGDVPTNVLMQMDPRTRISLADYADKGGNVKTDWVVYSSLRDLARTDPQTFINTDLTGYFNRLAPAQREQLIDLKGSMGKADKVEDVATLDQQLSTAHNLLAITGADNAEARGKFDSAVQTLVNTAQTAKGKALTFEERQKIIDTMMLPGAIPGTFNDTEGRVYEFYGTPDADKFVLEVPTDERDAIVEEFKAKGVANPTDEQISRAYLIGKGIGE